MAVDKLAPALVAEPDRVRTGLSHVRAQDGRQHRVRRRRGPHACEELLDLTEDEVGVAEVRPVVDRVELKKPRIRDVLGEVAAGLDRRDRVSSCVNDQGRYADCRQDIADVDQGVHPQELDRIAGAGAHLGEGGPPTRDLRVVDLRRRVAPHVDDPAPRFLGPVEGSLQLGLGYAPGIAWAAEPRRIASVDDYPRGSFGIRGGEQI